MLGGGGRDWSKVPVNIILSLFLKNLDLTSKKIVNTLIMMNLRILAVSHQETWGIYIYVCLFQTVESAMLD